MKKNKPVRFKETVGIDIGSHSIKIVHLKKLHDGFKLLNYEVRPTVPQGVEYVLSDLRQERFAPVIVEMLKTLRISPKNIKHLVSSIGGDNTSIKQIKTIFLPDEELESALFFEAKKHIPISGSDMVLDYQVLSVEEKTNNMNILLAASSKDVLNQHTQILATAGLNPNLVDIDSLAVANSFALNAFVEDGVYVMLNLGAHRTNMVIWGPDAKFFARDIPYGGYNFTRDIMRKRQLEWDEAENYKFEFGLMDDPNNPAAQTISMLDISEKSTEDAIVEELRRSLRFYVKEAGNSDFRKVYLMGGSAKLKGLPEFIQDKVNVPTEVFVPFINVEMPEKFQDKKDPQLALAIGLAMRME
ncbi:MAG: type IV pilus assembly protein PilM [Candidatus Cloacimonetes bacterium]|jgi:type IV pilus assembly protein PilM|nr:type IV pilus assembly protein PilM [Candidatus Cloacimonadota bacterium]MDY0336825.1 type IV pilus assembly protein PilM [Candidatus Cloacimonadaceae bacterium]MCB5269332.1 type IV pilus assembly protein PilM [Candidatus Cloacimonadota bacterium]MCK9333804.1 type IV pilus assembly protein PilM [Candidatus Cloacimonadota bacterium]MDD2543963.1 type IV pilus assembly protein PilM [Candidatus Cloacimonadota bacterium]